MRISLISMGNLAHIRRKSNIGRFFCVSIIAIILASLLFLFSTTKAATTVTAHFRVDISELDNAFIDSTYSKIKEYTNNERIGDSYGGDNPYIHQIEVNAIRYMSSPEDDNNSSVTTSIISVTKDTSLEDVKYADMNLEPGEYLISYQVLSPKKVVYFSSNYRPYWIIHYYKDEYYESNPLYDNPLVVNQSDNGNVQFDYKDNYTYSVIKVRVLDDGSVIDEDWNEPTINIRPRNYQLRPLNLDVVISNNSSDTIPKNRRLKVSLDYWPAQKVLDFDNDELERVTLSTKHLPINQTGAQTLSFDDIDIGHPEFYKGGDWTPFGGDTIDHLDGNYCVSYEVVDENNKRDPYWNYFDCSDVQLKRGYLGGAFIISPYEHNYYDWSWIFNNANDIDKMEQLNSVSFGHVIADDKIGSYANKYTPRDDGGSWGNVSSSADRYFLPFIVKAEYNNNDLASYIDRREASENGEPTTTEFKQIQSVNDIKDGSHYLIVAKNYVDDNYYALSVNGNSNAVKLTDFNDSSLDSYMISDKTLRTSDYVYTIRSSEIDGNKAKARFISNVISSNGRPYTLKLDTGRYRYNEMFNDTGGALVSIEHDEYFGTYLYKDKYPLTLFDMYGYAYFSHSNERELVNRTFSSHNIFVPGEDIYVPYDGDRQISSNNLFSRCETISAVALLDNNKKHCVIKTSNPDYYDSEEYADKNHDTEYGPLFILTDAELGDTEPKEQLIETTYYPATDIGNPDHYKGIYDEYMGYVGGFNNNFILSYIDESGENHILSATNIENSANMTYYPGYSAPINENGTITTLIKNSFSYNSEEDIKAESDGTVKLHGIKQNDERNKMPYLMIDSNDNGNFVSYSKSRKEISFFFNNDDTLYIRGSKSDRWIGWGNTMDEGGVIHEGFVSVNSKITSLIRS